MPAELGRAGGVATEQEPEPSEPQLLNSESVDASQTEKTAVTTEFDGTWSGTVASSSPSRCPEGKFVITVNRGDFGGSVTWYGIGAASYVRGAWQERNLARIRIVPLRGPALTGIFIGEFKDQRLKAWATAGGCGYDLSLTRE